MALKIFESFGYAAEDRSAEARLARQEGQCPFTGQGCNKKYQDGFTNGVCSLKPVKSGPVICCPIRMYADGHRVLLEIAQSAFGAGARLLRSQSEARCDGHDVMVFGKGWGKELRLPARGNSGRYFVDWILALLGKDRELLEFVAVEVQTVDTTGSYRAEAEAVREGKDPIWASTAGINWENVSKRILPQLIYKGHVLRREPLCKKGLFFVCPAPVYARIQTRLGGNLQEYHPQAGSLTFRWYDLEEAANASNPRTLKFIGEKTTTVDQVALAFTSPANLPEPRVYERVIRAELA